ncbi:hypothetical protein OOK27_23195 [Streptomyces canus]|nr:hypothetical protein [Streptomyces canus]MCX5256992.1 hypothetical protein [Streptomyces canus]
MSYDAPEASIEQWHRPPVRIGALLLVEAAKAHALSESDSPRSKLILLP